MRARIMRMRARTSYFVEKGGAQKCRSQRVRVVFVFSYRKIHVDEDATGDESVVDISSLLPNALQSYTCKE